MTTPQQLVQLENEIVAAAGEVDQALAAAVAAIERLDQLLGERRRLRGPEAGPSGVDWSAKAMLDGAYASAALRLGPHAKMPPPPVPALDHARFLLKVLREAP